MVSRAHRFLCALAAVLLLLGSACARRDEALREAWALWLEYEPTCASLLDEAHLAVLAPRWRWALEALAAETLTAMEEQLLAAASAGEEHDLLADLAAGSRRLCALVRGEPVPALASTLARAQADVAATRSRLAIAMPMSDEETFRRANRYAGRLSEAVSLVLERAEATDRRLKREPGCTAPRLPDGRPLLPDLPPPLSSSEREEENAGAGAGEDREKPHGLSSPPAKSRDGRERIDIRSSSGESWAELRESRRQEMARRLADWRPLYRDGMLAVTELRAELRAALEHETFAGLHELCARLGQAARAVPRVVVAQAPDPKIAAGLRALIDAYIAAGAACADGQPVRAWGLLTEGDRHRQIVGRHVERLASAPPLPLSLQQAD